MDLKVGEAVGIGKPDAESQTTCPESHSCEAVPPDEPSARESASGKPGLTEAV